LVAKEAIREYRSKCLRIPAVAWANVISSWVFARIKWAFSKKVLEYWILNWPISDKEFSIFSKVSVVNSW